MKKPFSPENRERIDSPFTRRQFLETSVGTIAAAGLLPSAWAAEIRNGIPYRTLGNTGEKVSCIGLGGYHLGKQSDEQESIRIFRAGLDGSHHDVVLAVAGCIYPDEAFALEDPTH